MVVHLNHIFFTVLHGESRGVENINPKEGPMRKLGIKGPILVDPIYNKGLIVYPVCKLPMY